MGGTTASTLRGFLTDFGTFSFDRCLENSVHRTLPQHPPASQYCKGLAVLSAVIAADDVCRLEINVTTGFSRLRMFANGVNLLSCGTKTQKNFGA